MQQKANKKKIRELKEVKEVGIDRPASPHKNGNWPVTVSSRLGDPLGPAKTGMLDHQSASFSCLTSMHAIFTFLNTTASKKLQLKREQ